MGPYLLYVEGFGDQQAHLVKYLFEVMHLSTQELYVV